MSCRIIPCTLEIRLTADDACSETRYDVASAGCTETILYSIIPDHISAQESISMPQKYATGKK